jgi:hypothetical protein
VATKNTKTFLYHEGHEEHEGPEGLEGGRRDHKAVAGRQATALRVFVCFVVKRDRRRYTP